MWGGTAADGGAPQIRTQILYTLQMGLVEGVFFCSKIHTSDESWADTQIENAVSCFLFAKFTLITYHIYKRVCNVCVLIDETMR